MPVDPSYCKPRTFEILANYVEELSFRLCYIPKRWSRAARYQRAASVVKSGSKKIWRKVNTILDPIQVAEFQKPAYATRSPSEPKFHMGDIREANDGGGNSIPSELLDLAIVRVGHVDDRTDDEIIRAISQPGPVVSEKNVWAFWNTGIDTVKPWSKRNIIGWVRLLGPSWTVRILDQVKDSPANIHNYFDADDLPDCLTEGKMTGRFAGQHTSDMVRLPCILKYGGVWMDVGIMLFMHLDQVCWNSLEDPASRFEVALASGDPSLQSGLAENFFFAARKGNGFIRRWRDILFEVWKDRTDCHGIHTHELFRHLVDEGQVSRFLQIASPDKLDYFVVYLAYERLRLLEDPEDGFNGPAYCKNKVLLIEYQEFASAAILTHDNGQTQFELLTTSYDEQPETDKYAAAAKFCQRMLSGCAMMKLYHWKEGDVPTLADLWDRPENKDADCRPGTFAWLLRYVSGHYTQQRKLTPLKFPVNREGVLVAGLLETSDE